MEIGRSCSMLNEVNDRKIFESKELCFCNNPDETNFVWP